MRLDLAGSAGDAGLRLVRPAQVRPRARHGPAGLLRRRRRAPAGPAPVRERRVRRARRGERLPLSRRAHASATAADAEARVAGRGTPPRRSGCAGPRPPLATWRPPPAVGGGMGRAGLRGSRRPRAMTEASAGATDLLERWLAHLGAVRGRSAKTLDAYRRDVAAFLGFMGRHTGGPMGRDGARRRHHHRPARLDGGPPARGPVSPLARARALGRARLLCLARPRARHLLRRRSTPCAARSCPPACRARSPPPTPAA